MQSTRKKFIPKVNSPAPSEQARQIDGLTFVVCRLPADVWGDVLSRLLADVGTIGADLLSSPDSDLDPAIEGLIRSAMPGGASLGRGKWAAALSALGQAGKIDVAWYMQALLAGQTRVETDDGPVTLDTVDELRETGIMPFDILALVLLGLEVNFHPTSAGNGTDHGSPSPATAQPINLPSDAPVSSQGAGRVVGRATLHRTQAPAGSSIGSS